MPIPRSILAVTDPQNLDLTLVSGTWPDSVTGFVFVSSSDQRTKPMHAFFGDGVLARLALRPDASGRFAWRSQVIETPSVLLRRARPDLFTAGPVGTNSPWGMVNAANTAPLPWNGRLFATWDAGRPVEVDPASLAFLGEVGHRDDWKPALDQPVLPLVATTAHPVTDPERGCMWSVSRDVLTGETAVIRYDGEGKHVHRWTVEDGALPQATHTISQTRNWLVLADTAYKVDVDEIFGADRTVANNPDGPVLLVRKDDLTPGRASVPCRKFRIAPEVNHFYADYDDSAGVQVLMEHTPGVDIGMYLRADDVDAYGRPIDPALRGMYCHGMTPALTTVLRFDPETGRVLEKACSYDPERYWQAELSAMDWSPEGLLKPTVHHLVFLGFHPEAISQRVLANYGERVDRTLFPAGETPAVLATLDHESLKTLSEWTFALDDYPTSPVYVPRPGGRPGGHDGHIIVMVHNDDRFRVELFDAANVSAGPIAVLAPPLGTTVPFLIHSAWTATADSAPDVERLAFRDDLDDRLGQLDPELAALTREVAEGLG